MNAKPVPIHFIEGVNNMEAVTYDKDGFMFRHDLNAGDATWVVQRDEAGNIEYRSLYYVCPCGCGNAGALPIVGGKQSNGWAWNDNEALPTTNPSILKCTPCRWHGYLTNGVFTPC